MRPAAGGLLKVDAAAEIVDAAAGSVKYQWQADDTDETGRFQGEFEITFADGGVQTVPTAGYIAVVITPELD